MTKSDTVETGRASGCSSWDPAGYTIKFFRVVTAVYGDVITVDLPLTQAIRAAFGGGAAALGRGICTTEGCGALRDLSVARCRKCRRSVAVCELADIELAEGNT